MGAVRGGGGVGGRIACRRESACGDERRGIRSGGSVAKEGGRGGGVLWMRARSVLAPPFRVRASSFDFVTLMYARLLFVAAFPMPLWRACRAQVEQMREAGHIAEDEHESRANKLRRFDVI
eukprot:6182602-Pleurochrysis_carterae.AAC.1